MVEHAQTFLLRVCLSMALLGCRSTPASAQPSSVPAPEASASPAVVAAVEEESVDAPNRWLRIAATAADTIVRARVLRAATQRPGAMGEFFETEVEVLERVYGDRVPQRMTLVAIDAPFRAALREGATVLLVAVTQGTEQTTTQRIPVAVLPDNAASRTLVQSLRPGAWRTSSLVFTGRIVGGVTPEGFSIVQIERVLHGTFSQPSLALVRATNYAEHSPPTAAMGSLVFAANVPPGASTSVVPPSTWAEDWQPATPAVLSHVEREVRSSVHFQGERDRATEAIRRLVDDWKIFRAARVLRATATNSTMEPTTQVRYRFIPRDNRPMRVAYCMRYTTELRSITWLRGSGPATLQLERNDCNNEVQEGTWSGASVLLTMQVPDRLQLALDPTPENNARVERLLRMQVPWSAMRRPGETFADGNGPSLALPAVRPEQLSTAEQPGAPVEWIQFRVLSRSANGRSLQAETIDPSEWQPRRWSFEGTLPAALTEGNSYLAAVVSNESTRVSSDHSVGVREGSYLLLPNSLLQGTTLNLLRAVHTAMIRFRS